MALTATGFDRNENHLLLKQLRERLASVGWRTGGSLAFDYGPWCEQLAGITRVFVEDASGDRFAAFEPGARIEICALATGM
jgi:hypothetical protein